TRVKLDERVVTGTDREAQKPTLGNDTGRGDVANTVVLTPPVKLQDMLSVNVPGVRVIRSSGGVGSGGTTRIRGAGSLSLSNEPLIYVDGVRVNNQNAVPSSAPFGAWDEASRVNDLDPEEIESIEVLKGPSAATIYGTEASNGVIQIITKRGRAGRPTIESHLSHGAAWISNPENRYPTNWYLIRNGDYRNPSDIREFNVQKFQTEHGFPRIFSTGQLLSGGGSISGGTDNIRYYVSGDYGHDEGAVTYNWQNKLSSRANIGYVSNDARLRIDVGVGAIRTRTRSAS